MTTSKLHLSATSLTPISILMLALLSGCGGGDSSTAAVPSAAQPGPSLTAQAQLGEMIFNDPSLSASGRQSCATCHAPETAHAPNNALAVQLGGKNLDVQGFRATPSLRYLNLSPAFGFDREGTPNGGFTRDGRAQSLAEQAERPFLAPHEMANTDKSDVVGKLQRASYAAQFKAVFGDTIFNDADAAFARMTFALQRYQLEDADFHPYDSKYDQFLAGRVQLDAAELRGLALYNNPQKANCAACHVSTKPADGGNPLFTDFTYDNIGVPRNTALPATLDAGYFDLGLCGPDRTDLSARTDLCGLFKVPTLRNVATRQVFFHNGAFTNLKDVVSFYVRRDTNPDEWYPKAQDGSVLKFNDLPSAYRANVNTVETPYNRLPGLAPALNEQEIDDVVRFLGTLTDGYRANN
jgi:cytochrome c peroxidase